MKRWASELIGPKVGSFPCESVRYGRQYHASVDSGRAGPQAEVESVGFVHALRVGRIRLRHLREHVIVHQQAVLFLPGGLPVVLQCAVAALDRILAKGRADAKGGRIPLERIGRVGVGPESVIVGTRIVRVCSYANTGSNAPCARIRLLRKCWLEAGPARPSPMMVLL